MEVKNILTPDRTRTGIRSASKKRVLEQLAKFIAQNAPSLDTNELFESFIARERLGSTAIGEGIAIPHCRMKKCDKPLGALLQLQTPVDFDAADNIPVDLVFALLVPEDENQDYLNTLSAIAGLFHQSNVQNRLRQAETGEELYKIILEESLDGHSSIEAAPP